MVHDQPFLVKQQRYNLFRQQPLANGLKQQINCSSGNHRLFLIQVAGSPLRVACFRTVSKVNALQAMIFFNEK